MNDSSIDADARAVIRYSLEINDPWLADLVRRVDAGETIIDESGFLQAPARDSIEEKIQVFTETICRAGDQSAAALLILMATLEHAAHPKVLAEAPRFHSLRSVESAWHGRRTDRTSRTRSLSQEPTRGVNRVWQPVPTSGCHPK